MKKKISWALVVVAILYYAATYWTVIIADFVPWTRTNFISYDNYINLLDNRSFYASSQFVDEIPDGSSSVKYYCRQVFKNRKAAHSIVLDENMYLKIIENQKEGYRNYGESEACELIYLMDGNECWSVNDLKQLVVEESFLREVMQNPGRQQDYYCLVVISINTTRGICYTGVIANDTTHEMIEFSVEIPDEY